jgi:hypothetical protein
MRALNASDPVATASGSVFVQPVTTLTTRSTQLIKIEL